MQTIMTASDPARPPSERKIIMKMTGVSQQEESHFQTAIHSQHNHAWDDPVTKQHAIGLNVSLV